MRATACTAYVALALSQQAAAVDIELAKWPLAIDGYLTEWGGVLPIVLQPGGEDIGLRGAFNGIDDHEADAYAVWDEDSLYVAVAVNDDAVVIAKIRPEDQVWTGAGGQRKDRMFYYDHLKVFIRKAGSNVGHNIWVTPKQPDGELYYWGHRQRSPPEEELPVSLAGELVRGTYTFEMALPWSWLEISPRAGTVFNAMILVVDSDLPGVAIEDKIAQEAEKWIWWTGEFRLSGHLPGSEDAEAVDRVPAEQRLQEKARAAARARLAAAARAQAEAEAESLAARRLAQAESVAVSEAAARAAARAAAAEALAAQTAPAEEASPPGPPDWLLQIPRAPELTDEQVHAYLGFLQSDGLRLLRKRISSRTDYAIVDMAHAAGTQRLPAREFFVNMLVAIEDALPVADGWVRPALESAAQDAGVAPDAAVALVREIVIHVRRGLEKHKPVTTGEAVDRAAKKAGISADEANALLEVLLSRP